MRATRGVLAVVALLALSVTACTSDDTPSPAASTPTPTTPAPPQRLTFGVVGPQEQLTAFQLTVDSWNEDPEHVHVDLLTWPTDTAMRADIESGSEVPDVFMASRSDLSWLLEHKLTQPVDTLLDERGVQFGDTYYRDALEAFSSDVHLQCMPYGVNPTVIYYNKRLVNFDRMRNRGLDAPAPQATGWTFDQFTAAADFATRPARGTKGVHIDATIEGLAPFISSGGGSVFDDADDPKSLEFSSSGSKDALGRTLELLRNPQVTLSQAELAQATPLRWFLRGKLGIMAGDRSLVPVLRKRTNLDFDVLPMPRLDKSATVGDVTGLCMSATTPSAALAADFMAHEVSEESVGIVTTAGYLQPANVGVALSDQFLQPGRRPETATIFNNSVRSMAVPPLIDTIPALEDAVAPSLQQMVYGVGTLDLDTITQQVDDLSKPILDPESVSESVSESPSASDSPSG